MGDRIQLVGLDVHAEYLKPGRYLVGTCTSEESCYYKPDWWFFRLTGRLQLVRANLMDDGNGNIFGGLAGDRMWTIYWKQKSSFGEERFSDIWTFKVDEQEG